MNEYNISASLSIEGKKITFEFDEEESMKIFLIGISERFEMKVNEETK